MDEEQKKENAKKIAAMIERLEGPYGALRTVREQVKSLQSLEDEMRRVNMNNIFADPNNFAIGFSILNRCLAEVRKQYGIAAGDMECNKASYLDPKVILAKIERVQGTIKDIDAVSLVLADAKKTIRDLPVKFFK